jgi:predicted dehydrogenase
MKETRVVLCGIGGYGESYLNCLLADGASRGCRLIAAIDPFAGKNPRRAELEARGILLISSLEEFFQGHACDLVIVSSPIQFHAEQVCEALRHGSHVLCEKPLCATEEEAEKIERLQKASGKSVTVGYQWSFDPGIQRLKADCMSGKFGRPVRFRTLVCWPRDRGYYQRNNWAGSLRDAEGRWILDSPVSNAAGHFLHNMLYVLGAKPEESAWPMTVEAHLFRANPIPNYDTAALRIVTDGGVELQFYASHATRDESGPDFIYEFEKATVLYNETRQEMKALLADGTTIFYAPPEVDSLNKLDSALASAREGLPSPCGITAARAHVRCVDLAQQNSAGILCFGESSIALTQEGVSPRLYVVDLQKALTECYEKASSEPLLQFWKGTLARKAEPVPK